jgi:hypothetical protein
LDALDILETQLASQQLVDAEQAGTSLRANQQPLDNLDALEILETQFAGQQLVDGEQTDTHELNIEDYVQDEYGTVGDELNR